MQHQYHLRCQRRSSGKVHKWSSALDPAEKLEQTEDVYALSYKNHSEKQPKCNLTLLVPSQLYYPIQNSSPEGIGFTWVIQDLSESELYTRSYVITFCQQKVNIQNTAVSLMRRKERMQTLWKVNKDNDSIGVGHPVP